MQTTSLIAYRDEVKPHLGERQKAVYDVLTHDMTNSEIAQRLQSPINTITPRIFELREKKLVREWGKRKCKVTGRLAIAWIKNNGQLF